jgi:FkbM family methyltransferase
MEKLKILYQIYTNMLWIYFLTALAWLKVRWKYGRFVIRTGSTDLHVFQQLFLYDDYVLQLDFKPLFIVDAGAYAGYSAIYFHLAYPTAKISCIEPSTANFMILKRNTDKIPSIRLYQAGIWSKPAFLKIEDRKTGNWGFQTIEVGEEENWDVRTVDVPTLLKDASSKVIDIFKIDIEGSEFELFSENSNWVSRVRVFIIEFHERIRPGCTQRFRDAISGFQWREFQRGENLIFVRLNFY